MVKPACPPIAVGGRTPSPDRSAPAATRTGTSPRTSHGKESCANHGTSLAAQNSAQPIQAPKAAYPTSPLVCFLYSESARIKSNSTDRQLPLRLGINDSCVVLELPAHRGMHSTAKIPVRHNTPDSVTFRV